MIVSSDCECELVLIKPNESEPTKYRYIIKADDVVVGTIKFCPPIKQWAIKIPDGRAITQGFMAKVWDHLSQNLMDQVVDKQ